MTRDMAPFKPRRSTYTMSVVSIPTPPYQLSLSLYNYPI